MKADKWYVFSRKCLSALTLVLGSMPFFALIGGFAAPHAPMHVLVYPALCLVLGCVHYLLPGRARPWYAAGTLAALAVTVYICMPENAHFAGYLVFVPGALVLLMIPPSIKREIGSEWPLGIWCTCVAAGLITQMMMYTAVQFTQGMGKTLRTVLACAFVLHLLLCVMNLNRQSMDAGTISSSSGSQKTGISQVMHRRNRLAVVLLFAAALLISAWKAIEGWLVAAWDAVKQVLMAFLLWLASLRNTDQPSGRGEQGGPLDMLTGLEEGEPSFIAQLLEKVAMVVAAAAAVVALFFLLRFLLKKLRVVLRKILEKLKLYARGASEDYVDETESIFDAEEVGKAISDRIRKAFRSPPKAKKPDWHKLDGRGKIRYLYRQFWERHPKEQLLTAREALMQENTIPRSVQTQFADLYDQARYSQHPVSDQDAEQLKEKLKY